jgi:hypothetical protein
LQTDILFCSSSFSYVFHAFHVMIAIFRHFWFRNGVSLLSFYDFDFDVIALWI